MGESARPRGGGLYSPAMLDAALKLAEYPYLDGLPLKGEARSRSCGSTIAMALDLDNAGRITRIGLRPHACAVGQAAASLFAEAAAGRTADDLAATRASLKLWLEGSGTVPAWPGIELVAPALAYPARHGAILLAWDAALDAMRQGTLAGEASAPLERPDE